MSEQPAITADEIRSNLLARATAYAEAAKTSFSAISKEAVQDDRFLARAAQGSNFSIKTYQRVIDWLDARESETAASSERAVA